MFDFLKGKTKANPQSLALAFHKLTQISEEEAAEYLDFKRESGVPPNQAMGELIFLLMFTVEIAIFGLLDDIPYRDAVLVAYGTYWDDIEAKGPPGFQGMRSSRLRSYAEAYKQESSVKGILKVGEKFAELCEGEKDDTRLAMLGALVFGGTYKDVARFLIKAEITGS